MADDDKHNALPINIIIGQAEDLFDSGNRWDAIELLDKFRENISPVDSDAQMLYCRVADSLRENEEYVGAHKALVQAFINRSDANAVHDHTLINSIDKLQADLSSDAVDMRGKLDLMEQLNVMHDVLYPMLRDAPAPAYKPNEPEDDLQQHYEHG